MWWWIAGGIAVVLIILIVWAIEKLFSIFFPEMFDGCFEDDEESMEKTI